ncbi:MAG TPA: FG-GAP-like repeat-containing protein [Vicinamibacterales bacterium]|jgi:Flp pilus assembly protein TadD
MSASPAAFAFHRAIICAACLSAAACSRGAGERDSRERAYRANNRGVAALEQFDYANASTAFRDALQVNPALGIAHFNLGLALFYNQDFAGAAREAGEAARLLPDSPQPPYLLGLIARAENKTADARSQFERVRRVDPADVGARIGLAQIDLEERQYTQAIDLLRPAIDVEPYNVTAAYNLGLALTRDGQADEGRRELERAQQLRSTGYAVTYGNGYLEQGRYAEAIASTGAEPDLVDTTEPSNTFAPAAVGGAPPPGPIAASPFGRSFTAAGLASAGAREILTALGGCLTLLDVDGDGDLDLFDATGTPARLFRNDGGGRWTDVSSASGLAAASIGPAIGCVAGDYDNDGRTDLLMIGAGTALFHNEGGGRFADVTRQAGIAPYGFVPGAAAFVDVDHDGDLDVVIAGLADLDAAGADAQRPRVFPDGFPPAPLRLLRNNGNGTFTDITAAAKLDARTHAVAIIPTDFDNRRDVDLLVVNHGAAPLLFQNLRDGTFRDVASDTGLTAALGSQLDIRSASAADVNKDGYPDVLFGRADGSVLALSDGRGRFSRGAVPDGAPAGLAAALIDYDEDGLTDLLAWSDAGLHVFRNVGAGSSRSDAGPRWADVSTRAVRGSTAGLAPASARALAIADLDRDGRTDLVAGRGGALATWRNEGGANRALAVDLKGRVSNRLGIGAKVEVRAGSLSARLETSAATPPAGRADLLFGLGGRPGADAVRVLWPSGILQAETRETPLPSPLAIEELDRKPSSCPFLFTWNGERFEFVTDFMGAGEMGYLEEPGRRNTPDPVEYVRIESERLVPQHGRYELRVTNELEETLFADRMRLIAVAHPSDVAVYPDEGMTEHAKPFRLFAVADRRVPRAIDDHGHDVTDRVARIDRRYPDDFALERFRGYAAPHTLTLDLAPLVDRPALLLTAWTDYAFSSDNLAAAQAGLTLPPPSLEVRDGRGQWRTVVDDIGIPVGRPQTVTVDLAGRLRPGEHEVRIVTSMRIYWDRILVGRSVDARGLRQQTLDPISATLTHRGFSAEVRPDGQEPPVYDYGRVSSHSPWKTMPGRYTREGDVGSLLSRTDDMFVIAAPGDEIALAFDATAVGAVPSGWTLTFLLEADGYSKEMDINSASPDAVAPLPFHAMRAYPYRAPEHYPDTPEHQRYQAEFNTRVIGRSVPPLVDGGVAGHQ